jgi:hypothetical protein
MKKLFFNKPKHVFFKQINKMIKNKNKKWHKLNKNKWFKPILRLKKMTKLPQNPGDTIV